MVENTAPNIVYRANINVSFYHILSKSCLSKLRNMEPGQSPEDYGPMLESMCNWGKADDVLELVAEWFGRGLEMAKQEEQKKVTTRHVHDMTIVYCLGAVVRSSSVFLDNQHQTQGRHPQLDDVIGDTGRNAGLTACHSSRYYHSDSKHRPHHVLTLTSSVQLRELNQANFFQYIPYM
jgi:hypothetical protein